MQDDSGRFVEWLIALLLCVGLLLFFVSVLSLFMLDRANSFTTRIADVGLVPALIIAAILIGVILVALETSLLITVVVALLCGALGGLLYLSRT
jgi:hypothetical protein